MKTFKSIEIICLPSWNSWRNAKCRETSPGIKKLKLEFWGGLPCDNKVSASWSNIDWTWQCFAHGQFPTIGGEVSMMSHPVRVAICNWWLKERGKCLFFKVETLRDHKCSNRWSFAKLLWAALHRLNGAAQKSKERTHEDGRGIYRGVWGGIIEEMRAE